MIVEGQIVDLHNREIFEGSIEVKEGRITEIRRHTTSCKHYIMPGFVDAHVHIESSMLTPSAFGDMVASRGTVAVVTDPHEIANVAGMSGIDFMLRDAEHSAIKCYFTIPSCVPATDFDSAAGKITAQDVECMASSGKFVALSEMMNVPGVLFKDPEVIAKLESAKKHALPIDGHAPLLMGEQLSSYINAGISTDHETSSLEEALQRISQGMKILIREGSAAKNFDALKPLLSSHPDMVMFCTDDSHPHDILQTGHIDKNVRRAVREGYNLFSVLRAASINAINHYGLDVGTLKLGDWADFIVVDNLTDFNTLETYVNGNSNIQNKTREVSESINNFWHDRVELCHLAKAVSCEPMTVIGLVDNQLLTTKQIYTPSEPSDNLQSDIEQNINKIVYINRYNNSKPVVEYCKGFSLREGALASSVSHDSHNIIAIGANDYDLELAINAVIDSGGALALSHEGMTSSLALPIGGIMSDLSGDLVAEQYMRLQEKVREMGIFADSPFMSMSFLSLLVIPEIKIGELGLFSFSDFNWMKS